MMKLLALAFATGAHAASVALPDTFDLTCQGTHESIMNIPGGDREEPYVTVFRIDLGNRIWCQDECLRTYPIVKFDSQKIILQEVDKPKNYVTNVIDRRMATHKHFMSVDLSQPGEDEAHIVTIIDNGLCEPSVFTPIPPLKQKF